MTGQGAVAALMEARQAVRETLAEWNAGDLERIATCRHRLETVAQILRAAAEHADETAFGEGSEQLLGDLKADIARFTQVVDAASAFQRGLALQSGAWKAENYDASGTLVEEGHAAGRGLEG